ncbi:POPLD domain-containing protein [Pseudomassariella vexata]|uniref:POPLD domain-containing protein n=1 Tax=Pseudomassariella vexata TaxID=1141098 RepID=A0A1Y2E7V8_9PEZI|nr:POPLD domain-containing protein [Pseudomassariella vexata]ORY67653.1 POPLD domain-containing protein [Pseudomassariella vexata]
MPPPPGDKSGKSGGQKKRLAGDSLGPTTGKRPKPNGKNMGSSNQPGQSNQGKDGRQSSNKSRHGGKDAPSNNGPEARRMKNRAARSIPSQRSDSALKDGELDLQSFVNSRGFEVKALDESMRRTRATRSSRAFQQVPYTLRRRAAAHNHKRVPKRLQKRAKKEMAADNTPTVNAKTRKPSSTRDRLRSETVLRLGKLAERRRKQKLLKRGNLDKVTIETRMARPKIRRNTLNDPLVTIKKFKKRQLNKTWLPTHLWHAKRARLTEPNKPLWRFAIPITPTQKVYRPAHRIQWEKGVMAWDTSYMSTIGLCGTPRSVEHVLKGLCLTQAVLWNDKGAKWRSGAVCWSGTLRRKVGAYLRIIAPASIIWNPESVKRTNDSSEPPKQLRRRLFIRIHPSSFLEAFEELNRLVKGQNPRPYIEDLRYEIGSIEVTGPNSTEALLGLLKPYYSKTESKEPHVAKFQSLAGLQDPASLPLGSLLAFSIMDPRLRYPPRRTELPDMTNQEAQLGLLETLSKWHQTEDPVPFALFDRDARFKASQLPTQQSLNRRRGKNAPGVFLEPSETDTAIPIILTASRQSPNAGTWTLMMPWKCILPLWHSLMHFPLSTGGNPGLGGLNEKRQLAFEQGIPWFPGDFPGTDAGMAWELEQRHERKKAWDRMPKGKRIAYEALDLGAGRKGEVGDGWDCGFETLFELPESGTDASQPDEESNVEIEGTEPAKENKSTKLMKHALTHVIHLTKSAFNAYVDPKSDPFPLGAIVTVKIRTLSRGTPAPCARIYRLPTIAHVPVSTQAEVPATEPTHVRDNSKLPSDLRDQWLAKIPGKTNGAKAKPPLKHNSAVDLDVETRKRLLAQELIGPPPSQPNEGNVNGHPFCPDAEDLIGFVTTGSFNLRNGCGEGIGSISAEMAREELGRYKNKDDPAARVCVVRNAGQAVGWVARWDLV